MKKIKYNQLPFNDISITKKNHPKKKPVSKMKIGETTIEEICGHSQDFLVTL